MKFLGLRESIIGWKAIIETELGIPCSEIIDEQDRAVESVSFTVELSTTDRDRLQNEFWYAVEDGQTSPWNWRIAFDE